MENATMFLEKAKTDLNSIFEQLNSAKFTYNQGFSEQLNNDLEEVIVTETLIHKLENAPKTETVINFSQTNEPQIKKSFFSKKVTVILTGKGDSYWTVDGKKSSIPGEIETTGIRENQEAEYRLGYKKIDGQYILVDFSDDNGQYLGESRTWPGRPELMKKYKENPSIIK